MSGQLRKALGPIRGPLKTVMEAKPVVLMEFASERDREKHLRDLRAYQIKLKMKFARFKEYFDKLVDLDVGAIEGNEQRRNAEKLAIDETIAQDMNLIAEYDDLIAELEASMKEISFLYENERVDNHISNHSQSISPITKVIPKTNAKLPKLNLAKFDGDVKNWFEFWDSFESVIHNNTFLSSVDKINYLRAQLTGEAKTAIAGLSATAENYSSAIDILKNRYGKIQRIIDAHYFAMTNLPPSNNNTANLRKLFDTFESHFFSLEALNQQIEHQHFVSMIKSKLPINVILQLEDKIQEENWSVKKLREQLGRLISAREMAEASSTSAPTLPKRDLSKPLISNKPTTSSLFTSESNSVSKTSNCIYCGEDHWSSDCNKYATISARKARIKGSCFICLQKTHKIKQCNSTKLCYFCKAIKSHHQSLCPKKYPLGENEVAYVAYENQSISNTTVSAQSIDAKSLLATGESVLLQTATVIASAITKGDFVSTRLLLDSGSQRSYISESLKKKLNLKSKEQQKLNVFTFGSLPPKSIETSVVELKIQLIDGSYFEFSANAVPAITGTLQRSPIDPGKYGVLYKDLVLADPIITTTKDFTVDILIGSDFFWDIVTSEKIELEKGLYLIGSKLGWILCGRHPSNSSSSHFPHTIFSTNTFLCPVLSGSLMTADPILSRKLDLKNFWDLETVGIKDKLDDCSDEKALKNFNDTILFKNKRYYVSWPWKDDDTELPSNFHLSLGRLNSLIKRHKDNPQFFQNYQSIIQTQLEKGIIESVNNFSESNGTCKHYIPHHAVITPEKTTTKMRIVYDGSAKSKKENKSLNECLHRGPIMLEDLVGILLRFRLNKVALVSDIEKAFLTVGLQEKDRDVTRFLWLKDPKVLSTNNNIQIYRFTRVPFGIISSPFLLAATITYHMNQYGGEIGKQILNNLYVDNIITGVDSIEAAIVFYNQTKDLFQQASMNIREWASNSTTFMNSVHLEDRASNDRLNVLGILWDTKADKFSISIPKFLFNCVTKRFILQFTASIFDPLGLISPVLLLAKVFLQRLWQQKIDWDDKLPSQLNSEWFKILADMTPNADFTFQRFIGISSAPKIRYELHCFCDASEVAYGSCVYLRIITEQSTSVKLLFAKSRLAPLKSLTLPRLELLAVFIGSKCLDFTEGHLHLKIDKSFIWTDSQCVLHWLSSKKPLSVFVKNRINTIKKLVNVRFYYVPTSTNPADLASRGMSASKLIDSFLWWHGPDWLTSSESSWPKQDFLPDDLPNNKEILGKEEKSILYATSTLAPEGPNDKEKLHTPFEIDQNRYSSLTKLLRVTAWAARFVRKLKGKSFESPFLTAEEITEVKNSWVRCIQQKHFADVLSAMEQNKRHPLQEQFSLYIEDGILKCRSRLSNSDLPTYAVYPKLLPKGDHFTRLIIEYYHRKIFHAGVSHTLAQVRNEFWVPAGRSEVCKVIRKCLSCRRVDGGPYKLPDMAPLPKSRVTPSMAFSHCGLDYMGPLFIKENGNSKKVWVCLFTCMASRAIHLELVPDMTAEQFLLCLMRFIARRGKPLLIISDNAKQFKLVASTIQNVWQNIITSEAVTTYMSDESISWQFITENAPWKGGFYERLVRLVKQALRKSIGKITLTFIQLQTIIIEIEAAVNSRPLTYIGSDFASGQAITPAHFLSTNTKTGLPPINKTSASHFTKLSKDTLIENWKRGQRHLEQFWKVWRQDYLLNLRQRFQRGLKQPHIYSSNLPSVGDVVHIHHNGPRGSWKLARIQNLIRSSDGSVRTAEVVLPNGTTFRRSLMHLYPLECDKELEVTPILWVSECRKA